ncbi:MAG TPA: polyprenyl diphosphate synthase [Candidatus Nanoarchaeia archaeon]|nr:polyprenyl diphosphate synthase [Candidatus Nanoarchaeia archaeon]
MEHLPKHIGIILDGNRRYGKKHLADQLKGHNKGAEVVEQLFEWIQEFNIPQITLYAFSIENFQRSKLEVNTLMVIMKNYFQKLISHKKLYQYKIRILGKKELFPKDIQEIMNKIEIKTINNKPYIVNFCMGYGGRLEIVDAVKNIIKKNYKEKEITEELLTKSMYYQEEPDLIIRTSEQRLSGFLTWHSIYSEILFLPNLFWPEFTKEIFKSCLEEYSNRQRRFGK